MATFNPYLFIQPIDHNHNDIKISTFTVGTEEMSTSCLP